jgi:hypothetical protein
MKRRMLFTGLIAAAFAPLLPKPAKATPKPGPMMLSWHMDLPDGMHFSDATRFADLVAAEVVRVRDEHYPLAGRRRHKVGYQREDDWT